MSDTKHTPGPWHAYGTAICGDHPGMERSEPVMLADAGSRFLSPQVGRANAVLIAAAPDLLAALETLLDRMTDGRREMSKGEMEENADLIRAALGKARGKP